VLTEIHMDEHTTNCIFDGSVLYVTATKVPDIEASQRTGSLWRVQTDATGLDLIPGRL
jgi:sugar lactone lactonase YvrE